MARKTQAPLATLPFMAWNDIALRTAEMLVASAQVIGHRTGRLAAAGASPSRSDRREFTRMGLEKIEAAGESAWAMGQHLATMNTQLGVRAWQDMMKAGTAWMTLAGSRTLPQIMARQAELMGSVSRSATSASKLSGVAAHLTRRGLKPIHARATANAKRLARLK